MKEKKTVDHTVAVKMEVVKRRTPEEVSASSLFGWLVTDGWCWFVLREEYCWLVAGD
jgi:hypothetical protein